MIKVLIVEDHASMRESLTTALTAAGDFSVVGEVPNADYALDFCKHLHPELVLMDVCTEGGAKAERMDAYGWALAAEWLGAGELLLVSMERGGRVKPCDADFVKLIAPAVGVPVASACGAADCRELYGLLSCGMASSVVSSTLFRRSETSILTLKRFLSTMGLSVNGAEELLCGDVSADAPELRLCAEA